jgi:hypothetical protein
MIPKQLYCFMHPDADVYIFETRLYCKVCNGLVIFTIKEHNPFPIWEDSDYTEEIQYD